MGVLPISIESQLDSKPHGNSNIVDKSFKFNVIGAIVGIIVIVTIPLIHIGIIAHIWDEFNYKVDKILCSCSCWDTVFKGIYERGPSGYKHVYFNATSNTLKIWFLTVFSLILAYESVKRAVYLLWNLSARFSMLVLFVTSFYPHYYSFWAFFNHLNDDFYRQWNHQLYFTFTEMISTATVLLLLDKSTTVNARKVLIIVNIGILHVLSAGFDQFIENVVRGNGMIHQVLRDCFFMVPDILHIILPLLELKRVARVKRVDMVCLISNYEFLTSVTFVLVGWFVSMIL